MAIPISIREKVLTFHKDLADDPHHRYRSWEHCYGFFRRCDRRKLVSRRDEAAIQLGFYLASWGMYRGSSFLLQRAYTVHRDVINLLIGSRFDLLWNREFGAGKADDDLVPAILDLIEGVRTAYAPFVAPRDTMQPTDTLITKILLGTIGCLPACDRYFISGFKALDFSYSAVNANFLFRLIDFSKEQNDELKWVQKEIRRTHKFHYPIMKIVDMYFWQIGYDLDLKNQSRRHHS